MISLVLILGSASAAVLQPTDDFYVLDDANVLDIDTEGLIVFSNDVLFADCGAPFVVVVTRSLGGEDIADYAYELYNDWAIGNKDGEGMLMLLVTGEENYYLLCGEGLSDDFSAGTLRSMAKIYIEPDFKKGDYDAAVDKAFRFIFGKVADACGSNATVEDGLRLYEAYLAGDDEPIYDYEDNGNYGVGAGFIDEEPREESRKGGSTGIILIVVLVIIILIIASRKRTKARARTRTNVVNQVVPPIINVINTNTRPRTNVPPPPPAPGPNPGRFGGHIGGIFGGSRPANDRHSNDRPTFGSAPRSTGNRTTFGGIGRSSGSSRSSFGGTRSTSSRSSFGGSRSGGASRSASRSGFGGGRSGGGGRSRGGGAGRGR